MLSGQARAGGKASWAAVCWAGRAVLLGRVGWKQAWEGKGRAGGGLGSGKETGHEERENWAVGWVASGFFSFSLLFILFQTLLKLKPFEFKFKFEFNSSTQTNKTMHQHECNNKF